MRGVGRSAEGDSVSPHVPKGLHTGKAIRPTTRILPLGARRQRAHNGGMNWMDEKLNERDRQKPTPRAVNPEAIQKHKEELARALESWEILTKEIKSDIDKWNARTPERRLNVSATPAAINVYWLTVPLNLLTMLRKWLWGRRNSSRPRWSSTASPARCRMAR